MTRLERAREIAASYMDYRGFEKDREYIMRGTCDYSTDVQVALATIIACEDGLPPEFAVVKAFFTPFEEGSPSEKPKEA